MADCSTSEAFEVLGLEPAASLDAVKCAYRTLAKRFHPDKNSDPGAKALFQHLNKSYRILLNHIHSADSQRCNDDNSDSHDDNSDSHSFLQPDISIVMRENTDSITIDILDMLFLAFLDECEKHHGITPIDRGHSGLQLRFPYTSPGDEEQYGSLSLTFYPTTSRLLVQGTSYLLWVEEHLPVIYGNAETRYLADISSWRSLALHRGIGIKRDSRHRRDRRNNCISVSNTRCDSDRVLHCPADRRDSATASDADCTGTITASITEGCRHDNPLAPGTDGSTRPDDPLAIAAGGYNQTDTPINLAADGCTQDGIQSGTSAAEVCSPPADGCIQAGNPSALATEGCPQPATPSAPPSGGGCTQPGIPFTPPTDGGTQTSTPSAPSRSPDVSVSQPSLSSPEKRPRSSGKRDNTNKPGNKSKHKKVNKLKSECHTPESYCYMDCVRDGKAAPNMIRCSLCMTWIHISCSGEHAKYVGVWTCKTCRRLPIILSSLQDAVSRLESSLNNMRGNEETLMGEIHHLKAENGNLKQKVHHLEDNNTELKKLIETMSAIPDEVQFQPIPEATRPLHCGRDRDAADVTLNIPTSNRYAALATVEDEVPAPAAPSPKVRAKPQSHELPCTVTVTVIGSSIVRGVAPLVHGRKFDATGHVYPGQTASQINTRIRHIPSSDVTVLAAGTNNIEHQTLDQCKNELAKTIDNVARKREGNIVIMGKIPQRYDKPHLNTKIDNVNKFIALEIAKRRKWFLMDVDLKTSDYKKDGLHFNETGTAKYAHEIRHLIRSIKSRHR